MDKKVLVGYIKHCQKIHDQKGDLKGIYTAVQKHYPKLFADFSDFSTMCGKRIQAVDSTQVSSGFMEDLQKILAEQILPELPDISEDVPAPPVAGTIEHVDVPSVSDPVGEYRLERLLKEQREIFNKEPVAYFQERPHRDMALLQHIIKKEHQLDQREQRLFLRERAVEKKEKIIAKQLIDIQDPELVDLFAQVQERIQVALHKHRTMDEREKDLQARVQKIRELENSLLSHKQDTLREIKHQKQKLHHAHHQVKHTNHHLHALERKRDSLQREVDQAQERIDHLIDKEKSWMTSKEELLHEITANQKDVSKREDALKQREQEVMRLRDTIQQTLKQRLDKVTLIEKDLEKRKQLALEEQHEQALRIQDLQQQQTQVAQELLTLNQRKKEMESEISTRQRHMDELMEHENAWMDQKKQVLEQLALQSQEVKDQLEEIKQREQHIVQMQADLDQKNQKVEQETAQKKVFADQEQEKLVQKREELLNKEQEIRARFAALEQKESTLTSKQQEISQVEQVLKSEEDKLVASREYIEEHLRKNKDLEKEIAERIADMEQKEQELVEKEDRVKLLYNRIAQDKRATRNDKPRKVKSKTPLTASDQLSQEINQDIEELGHNVDEEIHHFDNLIDEAQKILMYDAAKAKEVYQILKSTYAYLPEKYKKAMHPRLIALHKNIHQLEVAHER